MIVCISRDQSGWYGRWEDGYWRSAVWCCGAGTPVSILPEQGKYDENDCLSRVNNPLQFLGLYKTQHEASSRQHIPARSISGKIVSIPLQTAALTLVCRRQLWGSDTAGWPQVPGQAHSTGEYTQWPLPCLPIWDLPEPEDSLGYLAACHGKVCILTLIIRLSP